MVLSGPKGVESKITGGDNVRPLEGPTVDTKIRKNRGSSTGEREERKSSVGVCG